MRSKDDPQRARFGERWVRCRHVLEKCMLLEPFLRLPQWVRHDCIRVLPRKASVLPHTSLTLTPHGDFYVDLVHKRLDYPLLGFTTFEARFSMREYVEIFDPLKDHLERHIKKNRKVAPLIRETMGPLLDAKPICDPNVFVDFAAGLRYMSVMLSRVDHGIFWSDLSLLTDGRPHMSLTPKFSPPVRDHVRIDGSRRPIYRCGMANGLSVSWLAHDPTLFGQPPGPPMPVYMQSHALERLFERIIPDHRWGLNAWAMRSLEQPNVVHTTSSGYWVECLGYAKKRIGYFIVRPVDGKLIVMTFLFITMAESPEARLLARKLKLNRKDIDWLKLNELGTFVHSDLGDDPLLVKLFAECGLAHLFELRERMRTNNPIEGMSEEVRQYLGLKPKSPTRTTASAA